MANAITALPALLQKAAGGQRRFEWYALCASITLQAVVKGYSIPNIKWLCAQAALESNWGSSPLSMNSRNYFGMWKPNTREYFAQGVTSSHDGLQSVEYLVYKSPWQCAKDRLAWDAEFHESVLPFKASPAYGEAVGSRYHGSSNYSTAVHELEQTHKRELGFAVWLSLLAVPVEFYIVTKILT